jgi:hypothetical protein
VGYLEGEHLFAEFTVEFFEFDDDLAPVDFDCALGLQPLLQAPQVDAGDSPCAVAGRYQGVEVLAGEITVVATPTDTALGSR